MAVTLDASVGHIGVDGYTASQVAMVAPRLWTTMGVGSNTQLSGSLDGAFSRFASGRLTSYAEGYVAVDFDTAALTHPTWDVAGGTGVYRGNVSGQYVHTGMHWGRADAAVTGKVSFGWLGMAAIGMASITHPYDTQHAGFGTSARWQSLTIVLSSDIIHAGDATYTDATVHTLWQPGARIQTQLTAGMRTGTNIGGRRRWADISGVVPLAGRSALVVSAGAVPPDPEQAALGARYTTVALRVPLGIASRHVRPVSPHRGVVSGTVISDLHADGSRTMSITLPAGQTVEIMGDFTDWRPVAMMRAPNGGWSVRVVLAPGSHRVNIRVDAGPWRVPPDLPVAPDDFGGLVGLLVIR